jgi:hypothetical protein
MRKLLLATVFGLATVASAHADLIMHFDPANTFSGTAPQGSLTADFHTVSAGQVTLTLSTQLMGSEFVLPSDGFYFNLDPTINPSSITNPLTVFNAPQSVGGATLLTGTNAFKPDGDGLMDLQIIFDPSSAKALSAGSGSIVLTLVGPSTLTENSFNFLSDCSQGCGTGAHLAAVHVGNTGPGGTSSAWVGATTGSTPVPEPTALALLGTAIAGLGVVAKRKRSGSNAAA